MRKFVLCSLLLLTALNAFGHAGEVHTYLGTVAALHANGSFTVKKTDGTTIDVATSSTTVYQHADGRAAKRSEVAAGTRVSVTIGKDGKTATKIKLGTPR